MLRTAAHEPLTAGAMEWLDAMPVDEVRLLANRVEVGNAKAIQSVLAVNDNRRVSIAALDRYCDERERHEARVPQSGLALVESKQPLGIVVPAAKWAEVVAAIARAVFPAPSSGDVDTAIGWTDADELTITRAPTVASLSVRRSKDMA